ncbi:MAG: MBL fold metallo-hydrolase, partial [Verrucomicrobiota bacterium]
MKISITYPVEGVTAIRIDNVLTDVLSQIGGFDYALSYLIDETVLIDTGFSWARKAMRKALMELGADKTIKVVVNTHYHEDHIGNNDLLLEMCAPKFYAHPLAITEIRFPHEPAWYRGFLFGPTGIQDVEPAPRVIRTKRFRLELHHLPGHCP